LGHVRDRSLLHERREAVRAEQKESDDRAQRPNPLPSES
jgi:hypothetical protein